MGEFPIIDIVLFAMVAAFLFLRLRSVLGRRTGEERQRPNPLARPEAAADNVHPLPRRPEPVDEAGAKPLLVAAPDGPKSVAQGIAEVTRADPQFRESDFLSGARAAFEMIVDAYARGDLKVLRPLLADGVFENFAAAIKARRDAGETLETRLEEIEAVDVVEAGMEGRMAQVTVKLQTRQINVIRDHEGKVTVGDADKAEEIVDLWTFSRDTKSRDPNWSLVKTATPN